MDKSTWQWNLFISQQNHKSSSKKIKINKNDEKKTKVCVCVRVCARRCSNCSTFYNVHLIETDGRAVSSAGRWGQRLQNTTEGAPREGSKQLHGRRHEARLTLRSGHPNATVEN